MPRYTGDRRDVASRGPEPDGRAFMIMPGGVLARVLDDGAALVPWYPPAKPPPRTRPALPPPPAGTARAGGCAGPHRRGRAGTGRASMRWPPSRGRGRLPGGLTAVDDGLVNERRQPAGVAFPAAADGRRSTSALGRAVVADALRPVDPAGASAAEREAKLAHRLPGALPPARRGGPGVPGRPRCRWPGTGWRRCTERMRFIGPDGAETGLGALVSAPAARKLAAARSTGTGRPSGSCRCRTAASGCAGTRWPRRLEAWVDGRGDRAVVRGGGAGGGRPPRLAGPARPDGRGARGGRRDRARCRCC